MWAEFALAPATRPTAEAEIAEIVRWRREHQPGGQNAGSVFTNPAGRLGRAGSSTPPGCKGLRVGTAARLREARQLHPGRRRRLGRRRPALMREVRGRVREAFGVRLRPEVRLVGFTDANPEPWDES